MPVSHTVRLRISLGVSLTLVLLLAPLNWAQYELQRRSAIRELELLAATTGAVVVESLESAMMTKNRQSIQAVVDSVVDTPEIRSVSILSPAGEVAASPGGAHNGKLLSQSAETCQVCHRLSVAERPRSISTVDEDGQPVFRTMTPILNRPACHRCHEPTEPINGLYYMDISLIGLNARLAQARRNAFWGSVMIIGVTALAIYALLSRMVITPLEQVAQGMRRFGQGQRGARVTVATDDEVGLLARVFNDMAATIQMQERDASRLYGELSSSDRSRRQLLKRLIGAREEEQQRLARRIHDVLGQLLTGLSLYLKLSEDEIPSEMTAAKTYLGKANEVTRTTIDQIYDIITELRPTVLDDYGLLPALEEETRKRLSQSPLDVDIRWEGDIDGVPAEAATAAYRIAQEAFVNIARHAGALHVWLQLVRTPEALVMTIEDDGRGAGQTGDSGAAATAYRGIGITGMQERAAALNGAVTVMAREPKGTRVALFLPLIENDAIAEEQQQ